MVKTHCNNKCKDEICDKSQFRILDLMYGTSVICLSTAIKNKCNFEVGDKVLVAKTSILYSWNGSDFVETIYTEPFYFYDNATKIIWYVHQRCMASQMLNKMCDFETGAKVLDCQTTKIYRLQCDGKWKSSCKLTAEQDACAKDIYIAKKDAVVSLIVSDGDNWFTGTGFFVKYSDKLYIVTAGHLVINTVDFDHDTRKYAKYDEYWATVSNINCTGKNGVYKLEYVGVDGAGDVGVLKVSETQPSSSNESLPNLPVLTTTQNCLEWGVSRNACPGTPICVIGDPQALDAQSITCGVVRDNKYTENGVVVESVLHDVSTYGGNSGSPILTMDCKVIGVHLFRLAGIDEMNGGTAQFIAEKVVRAITAWDCAGQPDDNVHHPHVNSNGCYVKGYLNIQGRPLRARDLAMRSTGNNDPTGILITNDPTKLLTRSPWPYAPGTLDASSYNINWTDRRWGFAEGYYYGPNEHINGIGQCILENEYMGGTVCGIEIVFSVDISWVSSVFPPTVLGNEFNVVVWESSGSGPGAILTSVTIDEVDFFNNAVQLDPIFDGLYSVTIPITPINPSGDIFVGIDTTGISYNPNNTFNFNILNKLDSLPGGVPNNRAWVRGRAGNSEGVPTTWTTGTSYFQTADLVIRPLILYNDVDVSQGDILLRSRKPGGAWTEHGNLMGQCPFTSITWCSLPCDELEIQYKDESNNDEIVTETVKLTEYLPEHDIPLSNDAVRMPMILSGYVKDAIENPDRMQKND